MVKEEFVWTTVVDKGGTVWVRLANVINVLAVADPKDMRKSLIKVLEKRMKDHTDE